MNYNNYKLNLQRSPYDSRDVIYDNLSTIYVSLPETYTMKKALKPVRDQGMQGTCSAQAASAIKEWQEYVERQFKEYMSPQFVYNNRENQDSEGMTSRDTFKILQKIGIVPEKEYKYNTIKKITPELLEKAEEYRIQIYAQINDGELIKKALYLNGPCYIAFPVYDANEMHFWKPAFSGQKPIGGHAVAIVGWNKTGFIIRNSWGSQWGESGYTYYPYTDFGSHWEIWTVIDSF